MQAIQIIIKKRDRQELSSEEIDAFIQGYTRGEIPDYQAAAWAMAVLLNGMNERETTDLALSMARSGEILDLSGVVPLAVDKHSTGGVGDKTTLVVEPVVAACGLPVGKMSGRGLGFSGGTIDKMESIPGYRTNLSQQEFLSQLANIGLVLTGQSADLAPADGKLYALRDVTGTVPSIPLIASSIMSKKIAAGAQAIVLDVKVGSGAFMETEEQARELARRMVSIGRLAQREVVALLSDMNQPLGKAAGNALELREAINSLQGNGPVDFVEHCLVVAGEMLALGRKAVSPAAGYQLAKTALEAGAAWDKFRQLVQAQGGDIHYVDQPEMLPKASVIVPVLAEREGYLSQVNARAVGETVVDLGGGRHKKNDPIDYAVGVITHVKVGDMVRQGQVLFEIHAQTQTQAYQAKRRLLEGVRWSDVACAPLPLFYDVIR
ncbi:MAG TPA: thymidine phosphorylase [Anaerolineaceae bacterium]